MKVWFLTLAQKIALEMGLVVRRSSIMSRDMLRIAHFLDINGIDTVLDVGANRGNYALDLFKAGYRGKVVSFEPLPELHESISEKSKDYEGKWVVAPRCAVSDYDGVTEFYVTRAVSSSSMLRPADVSTDMPAIFSVQQTIQVPTRRLDALVEELELVSDNIFLKLDIQGGEEKALRGAEAVMPRVNGMVVELPLRRYYENQMLARELDDWIIAQGFELWDLNVAWRHPQTGRLDYFDGVYFRSGELISQRSGFRQ